MNPRPWLYPPEGVASIAGTRHKKLVYGLTKFLTIGALLVAKLNDHELERR